jgi:hypothetical protein
MKTIVNANRAVLKDPIGTRLWSGWVVQQYNSACPVFVTCRMLPSLRSYRCKCLCANSGGFNQAAGFNCDGRAREGALLLRETVLAYSLRHVCPRVNLSSAFLIAARFLGLFMPLPFWLIWKFSGPQSKIGKFVKYLNLPIILLYIGWCVMLVLRCGMCC